MSAPVRRKMVSWLSPSVLARTAAEVFLSGVFANYADKRELMGGLDERIFTYDAGPDGTFWFDYCSDVGDGYDPTFFVANAIAQPELAVDDLRTPRGRLLVIGGDEVYPAAKWSVYDERFREPYRAALPEGEGPVDLFALPGNHDWYDGLTSFMRVFCQGSTIGDWHTQQKRSYFAIRLPHGWWLWGIDIQFDAYIDATQLAYFTRVAKKTEPGDKIILATAKPSWVHVTEAHPRPQSWMSLAYFAERIVCSNKATVVLTITGDLHHYSRYAPVGEIDPRITTPGGGDKVTAGGGGAYLSPTHPLPDTLSLPALDPSAPPSPHRLETCWPGVPESRRMRKGILWHLLPWFTFSLNWLLLVIYGALALLLAAGVKDQAGNLELGGSGAGGWTLLGDALSPWFVLLAAAMVIGLVGWAVYGEAPWAAGLLHGVVQIAAATALTLVVLHRDPYGIADVGFWGGFAIALTVGLCAWIVGRAILTLYLFGVHMLNQRWHANEVFAAQSRKAGTRFKHFLRFRIDADGLHMYAIGVDHVPVGEARPDDYALELVDWLKVPRDSACQAAAAAPEST